MNKKVFIFQKILLLTGKTDEIGCIILIPSLYNIVVIDNFEFTNFKIDLIFRKFGIFLRTQSNIDKILTAHLNIHLPKQLNGYTFAKQTESRKIDSHLFLFVFRLLL